MTTPCFLPNSDQTTRMFPIEISQGRKKMRLSQAALARKIGVSRPTVWAWERGIFKPNSTNLQALIACLKGMR
jgi:DNA-binding transcriptional regulator YiaG